MIRRSHIPPVLLLGCLAACSTSSKTPAAGQRGDLRAEIVERNTDLEREYNAGHLDAVAAIYTDDAVVSGPNGYRIAGRDALDAYWQGVGTPINWRLDVFDVERTGERSARQTGRSTLEAQSPGQPARTSVVIFELLWEQGDDGVWRIASDAYWRPDFDYAPGIRRVLQGDEAAAEQRNRGTETRPMHEVVREYVQAMDDFDYAGTPGDFCEAMREHRDAWAHLIPRVIREPDLRGEMHDVLDQLTADDAALREVYQRLLDDIWTTWAEVERTAARHGVEL